DSLENHYRRVLKRDQAISVYHFVKFAPDRTTAERLSRTVALRSQIHQALGELPCKRINAWIAREEDEVDKPLTLHQNYILNLSVGRAIIDSMLKSGDADVTDSDIPDEGLRTDWVMTSNNVALEAMSNDREMKSWETRFSLHIPRSGDSEIQHIHIRPLTLADPEIQTIIFARGSLYRQFKIELSVVREYDHPSDDERFSGAHERGAVVDESGKSPAVSVTEEVIHTLGKYTRLYP